MNTWRARSSMLSAVVVIMVIHRVLTDSLGNTPGDMLLFHGSAMMADWLLLWLVAPSLLQGRLLDHSQWLLVAFMVGNAAGWLLYMAYAPPIIYDTYMWVLTIAQWIRILIPDHYADNPRGALVRHWHRVGCGNHH